MLASLSLLSDKVTGAEAADAGDVQSICKHRSRYIGCLTDEILGDILKTFAIN